MRLVRGALLDCRYPRLEMQNQDEIVRSIAKYDGHLDGDALAARDLLRLSPEDFLLRFKEVSDFARTFGLNIRSLAEFIAESGTGIEPWRARYELTREE
jgi:hypothetical protein